MIDVIILVGGFGTRLEPISKGRPKALMPVNGKPFLNTILKSLEKLETKNIYLSVHYKPKMFKQYIKNLNYKNISCVIEPVPMGTGGAVNFVLDNEKVSDPFLVINGDSFCEMDYLDLIKFHKENIFTATIGASKIKNASRYGSLKLNRNTITSFEEKAQEGSGWINNGNYVLSKCIFNNWNGNFSLEKDIFPSLLLKSSVGGYKVNNDIFIDIGLPNEYKKICEKFSKYSCVCE